MGPKRVVRLLLLHYQGVITDPAPSACQVRFSSNLPPTRQSRFGPEDEEDQQKMVSPENQQLLRGSAASHGFRSIHTLLLCVPVHTLANVNSHYCRRRQIHRLMSLQTDTRGQRSPGKNEGRRLSDPLTPFTHILLRY